MRGDDLGFTRFEFRSLDVVLGRHQVHGVGFIVDGVGGLGLDDLTIGRSHGSGAFEQVLLLLGRVKFDDDIAFSYGASGFGQLDDPGSGTCGAVRMTERVLLISPRVRTEMMKSPRRTFATGRQLRWFR